MTHKPALRNWPDFMRRLDRRLRDANLFILWDQHDAGAFTILQRGGLDKVEDGADIASVSMNPHLQRTPFVKIPTKYTGREEALDAINEWLDDDRLADYMTIGWSNRDT